MNDNPLFCYLSSQRIADFISAAKGTVCYAGPGIQVAPARAMVEVAKRIGPELLTVSLDFDERVMRMGYGDMAAVRMLRDADIVINHSPGLRSALVIVDREGYSFTPIPLYLEAESSSDAARNALRLLPDQVSEALARLSPAAKAMAIAQADEMDEKAAIDSLPMEVGSELVDAQLFEQVESSLAIAPPARFDVARQVRVFEPYLQYVELSLTGAAIQRHRLAIPAAIQQLGGGKDLEGRLRTTFDLIEKGGKLSSKPLDDALKAIRDALTKSLGKSNGRVVPKAQKPLLEKRLDELREKLKTHQQEVAQELDKYLEESRLQVVNYYLPLVKESPPDALLGQLFTNKPTDEDACIWLNRELDRVFPVAEALIKDMKLDVQFKDVTFETLNHAGFLESVKEAYPKMPWDKAHDEFLAAAGKSGGDA